MTQYRPENSTDRNTSSQTVFLRDFKYLDTKRLSDYLATIMPNKLEDIAQKFMASKSRAPSNLASDAAGIGRINWGRGDILEEEDVYNMAIKIGAKQLFTELHTMLRDNGSIELIPDNSPTGRFNLNVRNMVEITRKFKPALVTFEHISGFLEGFKSSVASDNEDVRNMLDDVRAVEGKMIPVIAVPQRPEGTTEDAAIVFLADSQFIIGGQVQSLEGPMAVCGKVQTKEESIDILDLLSIDRSMLIDYHKQLSTAVSTTLSLESVEQISQDIARPNWLARLFGAEDPVETQAKERRLREAQRKVAEKAMRHWKAIDWTSIEIPGPVLVIMPLAVYT
jgi:hypothetical protein